uniref:Glycosyl transferase CAP10 domain-containing protein n=1 Tax=Chlamydomonas leiostraca TaxID=1034604 RepID=A0A7S0R637_9CHLO
MKATTVHFLSIYISCLLCSSTLAAEHNGVEVVTIKADDACAVSDEDMEPLYKDNLYPDLDQWRSTRGQLNMSKFDQLVEAMPPNDVAKVLLVHKNKLYFPLQDDPTVCASPCNRYWPPLLHAMREWAQPLPAAETPAAGSKDGRPYVVGGMTWPDGVYYVSVADWPVCGRASETTPKRRCPAPALSLIKRVNVSAGMSRGVGLDIQIPLAPEQPGPPRLYSVPWARKERRAFWRGTPYCNGYRHRFTKCSRTHLANLTQHLQHLPDKGASLGGGIVLDVQFAAQPRRGGRGKRGRKARGGGGRKAGQDSAAASAGGQNYTSIKDHARYAFLVHMDGITASNRLPKLMATDSPVLKQESMWGEHFQRSLKPGVHYIPIFKDGPDDILQVLRHYADGSHDAQLQRVAANAQAFAAKFLCARARMLYLRKALESYGSLFTDMQGAVEARWWPMVQQKLDRAAREDE